MCQVGKVFLGVFCFSVLSFGIWAAEMKIGYSWADFHQARWKTDAAASYGALDELGIKHVERDAHASVEKQLHDIDELVNNEKVNGLVIVTVNKDKVKARLEEIAKKIPVILYDRPAGMKGVVIVTFDSFIVGKMQAEALVEAVKTKLNQKKKVKVIFIKGDPGDGNSALLYQGQLSVLSPYIKRGEIEVLGVTNCENWSEEKGRIYVASIASKVRDIDLIVASNDSLARGSSIALDEVKYSHPVYISGQDADHDALNRIAQGKQTATIYKDVRKLALTSAVVMTKLISKKKIQMSIYKKSKVEGVVMDTVLIPPMVITEKNLDYLVKDGWVHKEVICQGISKVPGKKGFCHQ